jgi:hypothetical protein
VLVASERAAEPPSCWARRCCWADRPVSSQAAARGGGEGLGRRDLLAVYRQIAGLQRARWTCAPRGAASASSWRSRRRVVYHGAGWGLVASSRWTSPRSRRTCASARPHGPLPARERARHLRGARARRPARARGQRPEGARPQAQGGAARGPALGAHAQRRPRQPGRDQARHGHARRGRLALHELVEARAEAGRGQRVVRDLGRARESVVRLLVRAEDPAAGLRRQILRSRDLGEALTRVRALFAGPRASRACAPPRSTRSRSWPRPADRCRSACGVAVRA